MQIILIDAAIVKRRIIFFVGMERSYNERQRTFIDEEFYK